MMVTLASLITHEYPVHNVASGLGYLLVAGLVGRPVQQ